MSSADAIAKARAQWARARDLAVGGGASATPASASRPAATTGLKNLSFGAVVSSAVTLGGISLPPVVALPPMPTPAPSPIVMPVALPVSSPSSTASPLPIPMPMPVETPLPMPVASPVPLPMPVATPTPIPVAIPTTPTPTPTPTPLPTPVATTSTPSTSTPTPTSSTSISTTTSASSTPAAKPAMSRPPTTVPTGRSALTLSRVIQETATIDIMEKQRYAAEVKKTLVVKNVPQNVTSSQIANLFNVPHGIRSIKWYPKGKVKNALVEFVEDGEGPQEKIDNLVNIDGNWLSVEPATISITQAQQLEYDYETRRQREAQSSLRMSGAATGSSPVTEPTPAENDSVAYWKARALAAETNVVTLERDLGLRRLAAAEGPRQSETLSAATPGTAVKPPTAPSTTTSTTATTNSE